MTRAELSEELLAILGRNHGGTDIASRAVTWLNQSQRGMADIHTFEEMRTVWTRATVADQANYGFPANMKDIYSMRILVDSIYRKVTYVAARSHDGISRSSSYTGTPTEYIDYGVNFELYPIPSSVWTLYLRCSKFPVDFAADGSSSELLGKDQVILAGAARLGYWALSQMSKAREWHGVYQLLLSEAIRSDHSAEDWEPYPRSFSAGSSGAPDISNPFDVAGAL